MNTKKVFCNFNQVSCKIMEFNSKINKEILNTKYCSFKIKEGVLMAIYHESIKIDLDIAKEIVQIRLNYQGNIILPCIIEITGILSITRDAREYFASNEGCENISCMGLLSTTTLGKFLGNFYLHFNTPIIPSKFFTQKKETINWLQKMHINNLN